MFRRIGFVSDSMNRRTWSEPVPVRICVLLASDLQHGRCYVQSSPKGQALTQCSEHFEESYVGCSSSADVGTLLVVSSAKNLSPAIGHREEAESKCYRPPSLV